MKRCGTVAVDCIGYVHMVVKQCGTVAIDWYWICSCGCEVMWNCYGGLVLMITREQELFTQELYILLIEELFVVLIWKFNMYCTDIYHIVLVKGFHLLEYNLCVITYIGLYPLYILNRFFEYLVDK